MSAPPAPPPHGVIWRAPEDLKENHMLIAQRPTLTEEQISE